MNAFGEIVTNVEVSSYWSDFVAATEYSWWKFFRSGFSYKLLADGLQCFMRSKRGGMRRVLRLLQNGDENEVSGVVLKRSRL